MDDGLAEGAGEHFAVGIGGVAVGTDAEGIGAGAEGGADDLQDIGLSQVAGNAPGHAIGLEGLLQAGGIGNVVGMAVVWQAALVVEWMTGTEALVQASDINGSLQGARAPAVVVAQAAIDEIGEGEKWAA